MSGFNMPPGVSTNMIPGNGPDDDLDAIIEERDALRAEVARLREALRACLLRDDIADDELGDEIRAALGGGK